MISVPTENGKIEITTNEWNEGKEHHSYPCSGDSLSLIVSINNGYSSFALTSPQLLPSICFDNKLVVAPDILKQAIADDQSFAPLTLALSQQMVQDLRSNEFSLLCYFYFNPFPSPVSFITRWFTDGGTAPERALVLARQVYIARTDKDDQDAGFIQDYKKNHNHESETYDNGKPMLCPLSMSEAFNLLLASDDALLSYDCLSQNHPDNEKSATLLRLDRLSETGFLIEDHAVIIVGLAVSITELARLIEHKWPLFYEVMLAEIPLYLRDFYSLGRLISEKPDIILRLQSDYNLTMDVISFSPDGKKHCSNILRPRLLTASKEKPEIPAFIRILK